MTLQTAKISVLLKGTVSEPVLSEVEWMPKELLLNSGISP
jgi:hypothetical protein